MALALALALAVASCAHSVLKASASRSLRLSRFLHDALSSRPSFFDSLFIVRFPITPFFATAAMANSGLAYFSSRKALNLASSASSSTAAPVAAAAEGNL